VVSLPNNRPGQAGRLCSCFQTTLPLHTRPHLYCRKNQGQLLPQLITNWGRDQPAEATAWVKSMVPGTAQKNARLGLCTDMGSHDPAKVWEMLAKTPGLN
jgi:hypothetical protein